jgi:glyoxylase-like metal-dependent hydrolase (beta-lactamase superfamily II)/rhodanese-related sulfurtransferase
MVREDVIPRPPWALPSSGLMLGIRQPPEPRPNTMPHPIVKTVASSGCNSYLLGCPTTRRCLLVDPKVGQESVYAGLIDSYGFELLATLDTHTHADHLSASSRYLGEGVELWMSGDTECQRSKRALAGGDHVQVGELEFEVLEVPGHTPDSIAIFGHGLVLTGDSLFIGGLARADFRGSDPALLFDSVTERLMALPDQTLVFPGHNYDDLLFSTIGRERQLNESLKHESGSQYAKALGATEGQGNTPAVDAALACNLERDPDLPESPPNVAACCASPTGGPAADSIAEVSPEEAIEVLEELVASSSWVDVREPWEFQQGHIPLTRSIPLSELGFALEDLRATQPLTISCRSGVRSMTAARTLERLGVAHGPKNLSGGILRWQELDYPVEGEHVS